jgi:hypothetical protein
MNNEKSRPQKPVFSYFSIIHYSLLIIHCFLDSTTPGITSIIPVLQTGLAAGKTPVTITPYSQYIQNTGIKACKILEFAAIFPERARLR